MAKDDSGKSPLKGWQLSVEAPSQTGLHSSAFLVHKALSRSALDARKQLEASLALAQSHALSAWESRIASSPQQGFVQGLQELAQRLPAMAIPGSSHISGALRVIDDPLSRSLRSFRGNTGKELAERGDKGDRRTGDAVFRFQNKNGAGEWDILKSLDKNLRTLEKAFLEGAAEHERRVRAAARKRAKFAPPSDAVRARRISSPRGWRQVFSGPSSGWGEEEGSPLRTDTARPAPCRCGRRTGLSRCPRPRSCCRTACQTWARP